MAPAKARGLNDSGSEWRYRMKVCVYEDAGVGNLAPLSLTRPAVRSALRHRHASGSPADATSPAPTSACRFVPAWPRLTRLTHPDFRSTIRPGCSARRCASSSTPAGWPRRPVPESSSACGIGVVGDQVAWSVVPAADLDAAADPVGSLASSRSGRRAFSRRAARSSTTPGISSIATAKPSVRTSSTGRSETRRRRLPGVTVLGSVDQVFVDPSARVEPQVVLDVTARAGRDRRRRGRAGVQPAGRAVLRRAEQPGFGGEGARRHVAGPGLPGRRRGRGERTARLRQQVSRWLRRPLLCRRLGELRRRHPDQRPAQRLRSDQCFPRRRRRSTPGSVKVGAYLGDYTRTSIGALLNAGTVVGPFGQLLANGGLLPRSVPPFCQLEHGRIQERSDLRLMFEAAATGVGRRDREWTDTHAEFFFQLYVQTEAERRQSDPRERATADAAGGVRKKSGEIQSRLRFAAPCGARNVNELRLTSASFSPDLTNRLPGNRPASPSARDLVSGDRVVISLGDHRLLPLGHRLGVFRVPQPFECPHVVRVQLQHIAVGPDRIAVLEAGLSLRTQGQQAA